MGGTFSMLLTCGLVCAQSLVLTKKVTSLEKVSPKECAKPFFQNKKGGIHYLGHACGVEAQHPLAAAGVDARAMPVLLGTHARVHHGLRMVLAVGQLRAQECLVNR